ncbi:Activating molecule in BECN1-regulated autophagy protein 1 [Holothuria leucospilota]|uniref:Activating molecule in BECN1-regulated autophagy protein 1 n=1 Tax=Holothuria leucospilota TaxID=206669 RepID=A0A9Q1BEU3_HOLLE|nr:Activating molecule in BECN1-regulated autophagy protein 1 [Holothuria leucospilota]
MKSPNKTNVFRTKNLLTVLQDRKFRGRRRFHQRNLEQFVDNVTTASSFDNKAILSGQNLRSTFMIVFSQDGNLVASSHGSHTIKICRLPSLECIQTLSGHPRSVWCMNFHPSSSELLASGCLGGQVRVWDLEGRSEVWNSKKGTTITSLSFHPYERLLLIATGNQILLWDWSKRNPIAAIETSSSDEYIRLVRFDRHGHHLLTGITNQTRGTEESSDILRPLSLEFRSGGDDDNDSEVPTEADTFPEPSLAEPPITGEQATNHVTNAAVLERQPQSDVTPTGLELNNGAQDTEPTSSDNSLQLDDVFGRESLSLTREQQDWTSISTNQRNGVNDSDNSVLVGAHEGVSVESSFASQGTSGTPSDGTSLDVRPTAPPLTDQVDTVSTSGQESVRNGAVTMETDEVDSIDAEVHQGMVLPMAAPIQQTPDTSEGNPQGTLTGNGFLTSSHSGISSQRTPNRVVRVRRAYDGPELVQVRVISERFEGPWDNPPRISPEDLSNAIIIRTEETFHVPDMPNNATAGEPQAARALFFDSDNSNNSTDSGFPSEGAPEEERSPFTGLPMGSSLLDHVPNRNNRVEHQVSYPVSAGHGMVGHVTITRSSPADSLLMGSLQQQRGSLQQQRGPTSTGGNVARRNQGARRVLPTQLHSPGGRRRVVSSRNGRDEEGSLQDGGRRQRLSRSGFARTAIRRRSGNRRHAQNVENDSPSFPQGEYLINQALADAFRGRWSSPAVANNISLVTHRLQWWDFNVNSLPNIGDAKSNVVVPCCKLYSDASCDISKDEKFLTTFVPYNFPDQFVVAAYSLEKETFGQIMYSMKLGADAITLSISPSSNYLLVGVASGRYHYPATQTPLAMICKFSEPTGEEGSIRVIQTVTHPSEGTERPSACLNIAKWIPTVGAGFVYGTDKGDLRICTPRYDISRVKGGNLSSRFVDRGERTFLQSHGSSSSQSRQRGQSTQTRRRTHSAGTQTDLTSRFVRRMRRRLNLVSSSRLPVAMNDTLNGLSPGAHPTSASSSAVLNLNFSPEASRSAVAVHPTSVADMGACVTQPANFTTVRPESRNSSDIIASSQNVNTSSTENVSSPDISNHGRLNPSSTVSVADTQACSTTSSAVNIHLARGFPTAVTSNTRDGIISENTGHSTGMTLDSRTSSTVNHSHIANGSSQNSMVSSSENEITINPTAATIANSSDSGVVAEDPGRV